MRYAKALFESALEHGIMDKVQDDLKVLLSLDKQLPEFRDLLESPIINAGQKQKIFSSLFLGKVDDLTFRFIILLAQNKREAFLASVCRVFQDLYKKKKGIMAARVSTAGVLQDATAERMKKSLEGYFKSQIELETEMKPELIGGFVLRVEDQQLDASVASQLKKIRKELGQSVIS